MAVRQRVTKGEQGGGECGEEEGQSCGTRMLASTSQEMQGLKRVLSREAT